ncbi:hypothetical protein [Lapillicoccus jejuensis]|uniref:Uncharacterized protein n=1 Tax=Lapillicoccus jejuensis TaxID=402171 RepID=A0A542E3A2_9MICO|nr:hypothetical protein [Lapillicoccus jejuensis]TQJ09813.1 hypothetical protein FB458_2929 [Lapillicoccus jejuensis]
MLALVIALVLCVALGTAVVVVVAMPARREGRQLLGPAGEQVVERVRDVAHATRGRTADPATRED